MAATQLAEEVQAGDKLGPTGMWGTPGVQLPPSPGVLQLPCPCPAPPGSSLLLLPRLSLPAQPVPAAYDLQPLLLPGPALCAACLSQGPPAAPSRAKGASCRGSTGALKAWLGQHARNPYPSRSEKVVLALLSRLSLPQVSTWFANARRRLKKEQQVHRPLRSDPGEGMAEGEQQPGPRGESPRDSPGPCLASEPQQPRPRAKGPQPRQPKVWHLAEAATAPGQEKSCWLWPGVAPRGWARGAPELAGGATYLLPPHLSLALPWGQARHWELPL